MSIRLDFCDPQALTDSAAASAGAGLRCAFATPLHTLVAHTPGQVQPLLDAVEAFSRQGLWCVGYLRYEAACAFDSALVTHPADGPLAWFGVYPHATPWPDEAAADQWATRADWHSPLCRADFDQQMARIHQAIAAGECYQLNYTAPLLGTFSGSPVALFERLQRAQPGGYSAFIDSGFEQILSVSPELFFDWHGDQLLTRPMKGTAPRGATAAEDAALARGMQTSAKERAENVMIVDLLRNDVSRIALAHSVRVPKLFTVQTLPTVLQMVSDVTARTRPGTTLAEVFAALFPCGSVTGAPKVRAMQMIRALEPTPRGIYCGAIGVLRPGGHATFNVAIRTVTLKGTSARCGIGSGITADATAPAEWQEWQHKRIFLARASQAFNLLETLRLEGGKFQHLQAHLARLQTAASHFGYPFDAARICRALAALAGPGPGCWRVRLQLDATGTPLLEKFNFKAPTLPVWLALASAPFAASASEFTRFKTSRRDHYDAFAPSDPALFDTLLYNTQGELTECTRGNIALQLDGRWVTPALHCGLLAGVGRAHCLAEGRLEEAVVTLADLPRVQAFAFVNSLRGWLPAQLRGAAR